MAGTCSFYLQPVQDMRTDKEDLGKVIGKPVHEGDMAGWLTSGVISLEADGYRVDTSASGSDQLIVHMDLLKAYMHGVGTSIVTNIVTRITYMRADGTILGQQVYRGSDTSIDWVGGDGEVNTDFRLATTDLLKQVEQDLSHYCAAAPPPASAANTAP